MNDLVCELRFRGGRESRSTHHLGEAIDRVTVQLSCLGTIPARVSFDSASRSIERAACVMNSRLPGFAKQRED